MQVNEEVEEDEDDEAEDSEEVSDEDESDDEEEEEDSDSDGKPRKRRKSFIPPPPRDALPQRATRGLRTGDIAALQDEGADEEFWNQEFFAEEERDIEYETESEPEDRFDADFMESVSRFFYFVRYLVAWLKEALYFLSLYIYTNVCGYSHKISLCFYYV